MTANLLEITIPRTLTVDVAAFDPQSGAMLWQKTHNLEKPTMADLRMPVSLFTAEKDSLTYSVAKARWTLGGADGVPLTKPLQPQKPRKFTKSA